MTARILACVMCPKGCLFTDTQAKDFVSQRYQGPSMSLGHLSPTRPLFPGNEGHVDPLIQVYPGHGWQKPMGLLVCLYVARLAK